MLKHLPRWLLWLLAALLCSIVVSAAILIYSRFFISDEDRIRRSLDSAVMAVERKSPHLLLAQLAENYADNFSRLDKKGVGDHARYWSLTHLNDEVKLELHDLTITVTHDTAVVGAGTPIAIASAVVEFTITGNAPIQEILRYLSMNEATRLRVHYFKNDTWQISGCERLR
jgi:hypothetical protein